MSAPLLYLVAISSIFGFLTLCYFAARALCTWETCYVEDLQPTSPATLEGSLSFTLL